MKTVIYSFGLMVLTMIMPSCNKERKLIDVTDLAPGSNKIERAMSRYLYFSIDTVIDSKKMVMRSYYPLADPELRSTDAIDVLTFEYGDTAISVTFGREDSPAKITINTPESFTMISYSKFWPLQDLANELKNIRTLRRFIAREWGKLPDARFDKSGIDKSQRDSSWKARFHKNYVDSGVRISNGSFSYVIKYPAAYPVASNTRRMYRFSQRLLPPFLIYSLRDYRDLFGPQNCFDENFEEYIERQNKYGFF